MDCFVFVVLYTVCVLFVWQHPMDEVGHPLTFKTFRRKINDQIANQSFTLIYLYLHRYRIDLYKQS